MNYPEKILKKSFTINPLVNGKKRKNMEKRKTKRKENLRKKISKRRLIKILLKIKVQKRGEKTAALNYE